MDTRFFGFKAGVQSGNHPSLCFLTSQGTSVWCMRCVIAHATSLTSHYTGGVGTEGTNLTGGGPHGTLACHEILAVRQGSYQDRCEGTA